MDTSTLEEEIWVRAACHVLSQEARPMHYLDIKRGILQKQLVGAGLQTTLESALFKEINRANTKLKRVENMPGVFQLQTDIKPNIATLAPSHKSRVMSVGGHAGVNGSSDRHRHKYRKLKRFIKQMVFVNAAVCDEVTRVEEKVARVREERRFLLKRLLQYQPAPEPLPSPPATTSIAVAMATPSTPLDVTSTPKLVSSPTTEASLLSTPSIDGEKMKTKKLKMGSKKKDEPQKKVKRGKNSKRLVQPIPLDSSGRPIFPIELGHLTVHSLGEIVYDRPRFHTVEQIYPVGFCCTRVYASIKKPSTSCMYTCKILDAGIGPQFEISPDDNSDFVIASKDPSECHRKLLLLINQACGRDFIPVTGKGGEFFGLTHPTIQNLIQSSPGARKCSSYKWVRFEVCKSEAEIPLIGEDDPVISFDALQAIAKDSEDQFLTSETSSSLRSLLTSAPLMQGGL